MVISGRTWMGQLMFVESKIAIFFSKSPRIAKSIFRKSHHRNWLFSTKNNCPIQVLPEITIGRNGFCHEHIGQDLGSVIRLQLSSGTTIELACFGWEISFTYTNYLNNLQLQNGNNSHIQVKHLPLQFRTTTYNYKA